MKKKKAALTLEEIHAALLEVTAEFDRICREHGLRYTLAYGTLLGAVRHKGFIPWDDDVDVCMPREDYDKLLALAEEGVLPKHYCLSEDRGKHAVYPFLKMMDDRYVIKSRSHREVPYLFIDIFPLDGLPQDKKKLKKLYNKERRKSFIVLLCKWYTVNARWGFLLRIVGFWLYLYGHLLGESREIRKINAMAAQYPFEECELAGVHGWGKAEHAMPRKAFEEYIDVEFEGHLFRSLADYDGFLTKCYGDYMTPPPANKQAPHHSFDIYRK